MDYNEIFKTLINNNNAKLYEFQEKVIDKCLENKNIILHAPTGNGKTEAAIMPFIISYINREPISDRLIYALPLRALCNSLYERINEQIKRINSKYNTEFKVTIQTGDRREDELFEGDIIITTIDQALSAYLNIPISLPKKLSNINAGAFIGSLFVVDEVHLLGANEAFSTLAVMVEHMKEFTKFIIMSATMTEPMKEFLGNNFEYIETEPIIERTIKIELIDKQIDKQVKYIKEKIGNRSIIICNTVKKSQDIYEKLKKLKELKDVKIILLHSRFLKDHRISKENIIKEQFGKNPKENEKYILITTQVIEAGMDISCDTMFVDSCPADSLIQRIGRCARWGGEGKVHIFKYDKKLCPYIEKLVENTWKLLQDKQKQVNNQEFEFNYDDTINLVKDVHEWYDKCMLTDEKFTTQVNIVDICHQLNDKSYYRTLVRDIASLTVIIYDGDKPNIKYGRFKNIFRLHPSVIRGKEDYLILTDIQDDGTMIWEKPRSNLVPNSGIVAINNKNITYDENIGLKIKPNKKSDLITTLNSNVRFIPYSYKDESYENHQDLCIKEYEDLMKKYQIAIDKLSLNGNDLIEKTIKYHDEGKLCDEWQQSHEQPDINKKYAHFAKRTKIPPPHALISAYLAENEINDITALWAIITHHGGFNTQDLENYKKIEQSCCNGKKIGGELIKFYDNCYNEIYELLDDKRIKYWLIVRLLRLSDQRATKSAMKG